MRGTERVLQAAGLLLWLVVGVPAFGRPHGGGFAAWLVLWLAWGAAFLVVTTGGAGRRPATALVAVQSAAALALTALGHGTAESVLLVAVAGQLPFVVERQAAWAWLAVQVLALGAMVVAAMGLPDAIGPAVAYGTFQLFAFGAASLADAEARARRELAVAHAELVASRELLAEGSRAAERLRIARDLHDTLGHHLTALSLNLEVASHVADGQAAEHVRQAHAIARLLLADVREMVEAQRQDRRLDMPAVLRRMTSHLPGLAVHLGVADELDVPGSAAEPLVRCVQEAVTNAMRHSCARNLWIEVERGESGVRVRVRDDGEGAPVLRAGHGLTGMRERLEELGGRLEVDPGPGRGFALTAWIPA